MNDTGEMIHGKQYEKAVNVLGFLLNANYEFARYEFTFPPIAPESSKCS